MSDEIHYDLVHPGAVHVPTLTIPGAASCTIAVTSGIKTFAIGAGVLLITIVSSVLVVLWVVVVLLVEIWQPFLIVVGMMTGMGAMVLTFAKHRSMFYASDFATIAVVLLLLL